MPLSSKPLCGRAEMWSEAAEFFRLCIAPLSQDTRPVPQLKICMERGIRQTTLEFEMRSGQRHAPMTAQQSHCST